MLNENENENEDEDENENKDENENEDEDENEYFLDHRLNRLNGFGSARTSLLHES